MADPPIFLPGETLPAAKLQALGSEPTTITPTLNATTTAPTLGSGATAVGVWTQHGPLVAFWFSFQFGTSGTNAGSGAYFITLPVPPLLGSFINISTGGGRAIDSSTSARKLFNCTIQSAAPTRVVFADTDGTFLAHNVPWTWAASDQLYGHCTYLGDF